MTAAIIRANNIGSDGRAEYDYTTRNGKVYVIAPGGVMFINTGTQEVMHTESCREVTQREVKQFLRAYAATLKD